MINHSFRKYNLVDLRDISKNLKTKQMLRENTMKKEKIHS
jgi:hypothetical protein